MDRTNLVLVGRPGTGRSALGHLLSLASGCPVIEVGNFVRAAAIRRGVTPLEEAQRAFDAGEEYRFVGQAVAAAKASSLPCIVIGPRRPAELRYIQEALEPVLTIALTVPESVRLHRLKQRPEKYGESQAGWQRDQVEESWGLSATLRACNTLISTEGPLNKVCSAILNVWQPSNLKVGVRP